MASPNQHLNDAQLSALESIDVTGSDPDAHYQTLHSLERRGLILPVAEAPRGSLLRYNGKYFLTLSGALRLHQGDDEMFAASVVRNCGRQADALEAAARDRRVFYFVTDEDYGFVQSRYAWTSEQVRNFMLEDLRR